MLVLSVIATGTLNYPRRLLRPALGTRYGLRLLARQEGGQPHLPGPRGHGAINTKPAALLFEPVGYGLEPLYRPLGELLVPHRQFTSEPEYLSSPTRQTPLSR